MKEEKVIKVNESILFNLLKDRITLQALEYGGVDNWSNYSESIRDYLIEWGVETLDDAAAEYLEEFKED